MIWVVPYLYTLRILFLGMADVEYRKTCGRGAVYGAADSCGSVSNRC